MQDYTHLIEKLRFLNKRRIEFEETWKELERLLLKEYCLKEYLKTCEPEYCTFRIKKICEFIKKRQEILSDLKYQPF